MRKILLLLALACLSTYTFAQSRVSFGVRAGLNVDHQLFEDNGITTLPDNQLGFHFGAVSDIRMFGSLYFEPGLMFTTKGSTTTQKGVGTSHNRQYYLEMPLLLSYYFTVVPDALGISINAGPFVAMGLWGNSVDANGSESSIFSNSKMKRFDTGFRFGGALEFHQVLFGLSYDVGLYDVSQKENFDFNIKNRTLMISVGYNF